MLATDPERAGQVRLERGQYRVTALVPYDGEEAVHIREVPRAVGTDGEFKRIYFYKINLVPDAGEHEGEKLGRLTVVFHVIDNPIWIVPALYAATAAIGVVGGWFVIDKVEGFAKSGTGSILTLTAAAATVYLLYVSLKKKR